MGGNGANQNNGEAQHGEGAKFGEEQRNGAQHFTNADEYHETSGEIPFAKIVNLFV